MTNILFDREHINSFLVQGNWDVIDKSTIDCFPDAIILKMNCNKIFLKSHQYLEHPMAFTVIKKIEELTISYHLFGIAQIDQEPAFVLKPDLPFGTDSLIKSIVTNNLIFIHEEIVFYILVIYTERLIWSSFLKVFKKGQNILTFFGNCCNSLRVRFSLLF
jgi:hypothetical protein